MRWPNAILRRVLRLARRSTRRWKRRCARASHAIRPTRRRCCCWHSSSSGRVDATKPTGDADGSAPRARGSAIPAAGGRLFPAHGRRGARRSRHCVARPMLPRAKSNDRSGTCSPQRSRAVAIADSSTPWRASNPSWWPGFFRLCLHERRNVPARCTAVYRGARSCRRGDAPTSGAASIERLQRDGQWTDAYLVWLNGLPLEQRQRVGYVFNGGFELPLSNSGFDWRVPAQDAAVVTAEPGGRPDRQCVECEFRQSALRRSAGLSVPVARAGTLSTAGQGTIRPRRVARAAMGRLLSQWIGPRETACAYRAAVRIDALGRI